MYTCVGKSEGNNLKHLSSDVFHLLFVTVTGLELKLIGQACRVRSFRIPLLAVAGIAAAATHHHA